jgi:hypothetical protein
MRSASCQLQKRPVDEVLEGDSGSEGLEGVMEMAGGGAPGLAVDEDFGEPVAVEEHEGVEEIEEDGRRLHGRGFR